MLFQQFAQRIGDLALECGYELQAVNIAGRGFIWNHVILQTNTEFGTEVWEVVALADPDEYAVETVIELSTVGIQVPADLTERRALAMALMRRNGGRATALWGFDNSYDEACRVYNHIVYGALNALMFTVVVEALLE